MADDRTEQPTARRRRDARRRGQVARSKDVVQAGSLAASLLALGFVGQRMVEGLGREVASSLTHMSRLSTHDLAVDELQGLVVANLATLTVLTGPVLLATAMAVVLLFVAQGGWVVANEALKLNFGALNPARGFKRLGLSAGGIDTLKMLLLVSAVGFICYRVTAEHLAQSARLARLSPFEAGRAGWADVERMLRQSAVAMILVAAGDFGIQKWRLTRSLKMTKQEVKDDFKLTEGNPEIKGRVRRIQMTMARKRMLAAVPKATVVITNPTHYAVALEYRRSALAAPRVIAKGQGFLAQRIKAIAKEHGVPTVENVPLAQALYKTVEVGEFIPAALFEAVAEVLAYLIRLKQLVL